MSLRYQRRALGGHVEDLVQRLEAVKRAIHGCECMIVATSDGLLLGSTDDRREGELLAAVTSLVINNCSRDLAPFRAGECRALDFRGSRQILISFLGELKAYLVCVLHPGAQAVNVNEPALRSVAEALPNMLQGLYSAEPARFFLQRDKECLIPLRNGFLVGSSPHCDLCVPGEDVDHEHLRFDVLGQQLMVRDLNTRNGTKLNMRAFSGTRELGAGDRVTLPKAGGFSVVRMTVEDTLYYDESDADYEGEEPPEEDAPQSEDEV